MADSFDGRGSTHEARFTQDAETDFRVRSRRNKMLGLWLAERFGLTSLETEEYAKAVVLVDLEEPGDEDVMRKVMKDIAERGVDITDAEVRERLEVFYEEAAEEIIKESR
jgi:hypothetical protein